MLSLLWWKWFNEINLPPGTWLITTRNSFIIRAQHWFLLVTEYIAVTTAKSGLGEQKFVLLRPPTISILTTMTTLFRRPLSDDRDGWGKRLTCSHRAKVTLWQTFMWDTNIFRIFHIQRGLSTCLFPRLLCCEFSNPVPPRALTINQTTHHNSCIHI